MTTPKFFRKPHVWAFTTYFTEGFPFTLFRTVSAVFFRDMRVSLEGVGLTSLYGIPWVLKFLWSPMVDTVGTKRRWLLIMQGLLLAVMVAAAIFSPLTIAVQAIAILFFIGSILAATHDIGIDGYYMEALNPDDQAKFVGYRVMAYRIAMMTGTGIVVTTGALFGWPMAFVVAAVMFGMMFVYHLFYLPEPQVQEYRIRTAFKKLLRLRMLLLILILAFTILGIRWFSESDLYAVLSDQVPILKHLSFAQWIGILLLTTLVILILLRKHLHRMLLKHPDSNYSRAFLTFIDRERVGAMLAFVITLRAGEWMLTTMVSPFIVDLGIKVHYGWISALAGLPASIAGAILGGWLISRYTLKRTIWPLIFTQNVTNLIYMAMAFYLMPFIQINTGNPDPVSIGAGNIALVAAVHAFEQFSGGLGTAVLMTYLMRICRKEFKAAHYAIGSGLMNVSGLFAGVSSGFLAAWLGYGWLFGCSFLAAAPAMLLIPFIPMPDRYSG